MKRRSFIGLMCLSVAGLATLGYKEPQLSNLPPGVEIEFVNVPHNGTKSIRIPLLRDFKDPPVYEEPEKYATFYYNEIIREA